MGMWQLFKDAASKKLTWTVHPDKKRIDLTAPLGIRVGGMVSINCPDFILADGKLKIRGPQEDLYVTSYGQFRLGDYKGHRFYMGAGDKLFMLQVIENEKGQIDECKLFSLFDEIMPPDWDFWLNDNDGSIGLSEFDIKDGTKYFRAWENESEQKAVCDQVGQITSLNHIPPVEIRESIYMDPYGDQVESVGHMTMLYGRNIVEGIDEFMFVGVAEDKTGASVQITIGIPLGATDITVLF
jgi:hypothetical protein